MAKISEKQMETLIDHFNKLLDVHPINYGMDIANNLNVEFKDKLGQPIVNVDWFRLGNYECCVSMGFRGISRVDFNKIYKYKNPPNGKTHATLYSHFLPFKTFCFRYCNPWIVFVFEKVMFEEI